LNGNTTSDIPPDWDRTAAALTKLERLLTSWLYAGSFWCQWREC
jgi:hypothetical protein